MTQLPLIIMDIFTLVDHYAFFTGSREVSSKDRLNMPYTDAVIRETLRRVNLTPTALSHLAGKDLYVDGKV